MPQPLDVMVAQVRDALISAAGGAGGATGTWPKSPMRRRWPSAQF